MQRPRRPLRRRLGEVPVLPSLVTLGNLFFGFLAIAKVADALRLASPGVEFAAVRPHFELAVVLVFVAMVFDALDGRVARMTGQTTSFGAQLDSLADMVTFGVVPAFLAKVLVDWHAQADSNRLLPLAPKLLYGAAAVYVLGAALRLARFNVETGPDEENHREFRGLPSPAAAAVVCGLIALFCTRNSEDAPLGHLLFGDRAYDLLVVTMPAVLVLLGLLMISRIQYPHFVHALNKARNSLPFLVLIVIVLGIAAIEWQLMLVALTVVYVAAGPLMALRRKLTGDRRGDRDDDDDADEEPFDPVERARPSRN